MKKIFKIAAIAAIAILFTSAVSAQEWSKDQTEVWKVVQDTWTGWKTGNLDMVSANLHDKYQGWSSESPLPMGKESLVSMFAAMKDSFKVNFYNIEPARITVTKSAAVVNYYFYMSITTLGESNKTEEEKGKIVEFYVSEGGKWLLLGDMMVNDDEEDDD
jgi:hypothetical protein